MMKDLNSLLKNIDVVNRIGENNPTIQDLVFDSRLVKPGVLFFATKGVTTDGHKFIANAVKSGAVAVVCEELPSEIDSAIDYIQTTDASKAMGFMASAFYDYPSSQLTLVGVTGTNGKTTIATLLYNLVRNLGYKAGLFSTVTNYINDQHIDATHTTPDAVALNKIMAQMVEAGCDYCFMEVSSHSVVQHRIAGLNFKGGIFTNLTHDHLDYHKTFDAYLKAKKSFFDDLNPQSFAITNVDDKNGLVMVQNSKAKTYTYSIRELANFKARIIESAFEGMHLEINGKELWTPFVGHFNVQNLLAVYGAGILCGFNSDEVLVAISQLVSVSGRFETIRSNEGITAVVDYAHTPDALKNVIETINDIRQPGQQLITVVGAGGDRDKTKRPIMAAEAVKGSNKVILTSDNPRSEDPEEIIKEMMAGVPFSNKMSVVAITNRRDAIRAACMMANVGDIILVAGKGHETYQEVKGVKHHFDDKEIIREIFNL